MEEVLAPGVPNLHVSLLHRFTDPWTVGRGQLRSALDRAVRRDVPVQDTWRAPYLQKLLASRLQAHYLADQKEVMRLEALINSLVAN